MDPRPTYAPKSSHQEKVQSLLTNSFGEQEATRKTGASPKGSQETLLRSIGSVYKLASRLCWAHRRWPSSMHHKVERGNESISLELGEYPSDTVIVPTSLSVSTEGSSM